MLRLDPRHDSGAITQHARLGLTELEQSLRRDWPALPRPLVLPWSEEPLVTLDQGAPWLYGPIERDPLATRGGHTVVPRTQLRRLARLAESDLPFQRLAIAHELDREGAVRGLLPALRHGPRTCTDAVARELVGPLRAHPHLTRAAATLDTLMGGAAAGLAGAVEFLLDPIIFGVIAPRGLAHAEPALWYPLVAWRW